MQFQKIIRKILLKNKINRSKSLNIIGGAGSTNYKGWISTNVSELDITNEDDFKYYFSRNKIDRLLLEHVVEHLEYEDFKKFLKIAKKYLKNNGVIRIAFPDANHPSQYVKELTGVNGSEPGADDHKFFYKISDAEDLAKDLGYKIDKLEFFSEEGVFIKNNYNFVNGYISRCSKNYKGRFTNSKAEYEQLINSTPVKLREQFGQYNISYTSLLVDFVNE